MSTADSFWTMAMDATLTEHRALHGDSHVQRLMDQAVEEAGELIVALQHHRRARNSWDDVLGEYADLWLCMEFLRRTVFEPERFREMVAARNMGLRISLREDLEFRTKER